MGWALGAMIASSVLTTVSTVYQSEQQRMQQKAQAGALEAQASAQRRQTEMQAKQGQIEAEAIDRQKSQLRRQFEAEQGHNRSLLAAGNVDMSSGSALDVSEGNILNFAEAMGQNRYNVALKQWETEENRKAGMYQADLYDSQASYLDRTAGSFGLSLLKGVLAGGAQFGSMAAGSQLFSGASAGPGLIERAAQTTRGLVNTGGQGSLGLAAKLQRIGQTIKPR